MDQALRDDLKRKSPLYYAATLFATADRREMLTTLYAFDGEIKRVPTLVSEPMLGQIRLQWWREALNGERAAEAKLNPLATSVIEFIHHANLPLQGFLNLIDGEVQIFDTEPRIDEQALEKFFGLRFASLFQLSALVLDPAAARLVTDASGYAGMAYGIAWDLVTGRHAVTRADLRQLGETHLQKARDAIRILPENIRAAFLPLVIAEPIFKQATSANPDASLALPSYLNMLWRMLRFKI